MLEGRPILKDRLQAGAVFSGIAIAAVAGFELVITGGFDPITPDFREGGHAAPYARSAAMTPWAADAYAVTPTSLPAAPVNIESVPDGDPDAALAGAGEADAPSPSESAPSDAELSAQIDALYAQSAAYTRDRPDTAF